MVSQPVSEGDVDRWQQKKFQGGHVRRHSRSEIGREREREKKIKIITRERENERKRGGDKRPNRHFVGFRLC